MAKYSIFSEMEGLGVGFELRETLELPIFWISCTTVFHKYVANSYNSKQ